MGVGNMKGISGMARCREEEYTLRFPQIGRPMVIGIVGRS